MNKKRLLALVLAAVMSISTGVVAFADGEDDLGGVSVTEDNVNEASSWEELKRIVESATAESPATVKLNEQITIAEDASLKNCIIDASAVDDSGKSGGAIVVTGDVTFENVEITVGRGCRYGINFHGSTSTLVDVKVNGGNYAAVLVNGGSELTVTGGSYAGSSYADIELNIKDASAPGKVSVTNADLASDAVFMDAASTEKLMGGSVNDKTPEEIAQAVKAVISGDTALTVEMVKGEPTIKVDEDGSIVTPGESDEPNDDKPSRRDDNDSDYYGVEKWNEVKRQITDAEEGDTIRVSATGLPYFPSSVARELKGKDITLEIRKNGVTYKVNGLEIGAVDKVWYEFENIEEQLLTAGPEDKADEKPQDGDTVKENPTTGR